ncbi:MAG: hypothetical protein LIO62_08470 [Clostridiales bacterium]|nr:hypothetical protein [Clostridiales bacterium]
MKKVILSVVFLAIGILVGFGVGQAVNLTGSEDNNIITSESSQTNLSVVSKSETDTNTNTNIDTDADEDNENLLPCHEYECMFSQCSSSISDKLNNNPIDKNYTEKFNSAKNPSDEIEVLYEWAEQYEKECESAYSYLTELVNKIDNSEAKSDFLEILNEYNEQYENQPEFLSEFVFESSEFVSGQGTIHSYNSAVNYLNSSRDKTLRIIECIYCIDDYTWSE